MTAREIAERHLMQWDVVRRRMTMPQFIEAAVAAGIREGMLRAVSDFQRCSKEILAEIRAEAEKEKPDAE